MALYHLTAKTGTRAAGQSALAKAQYLQREDRYERLPDRVVHAASRNLPSFAAGNAAAYWDAADVYERANGRLFKEVEFALPVELEPSERQQLAESFAEQLLAGEKLPYTLAIHEGKGHNPHCHVLISERVNDGVEREASQWFRRWNSREPELGGARKSEALKPREWLEHVRERWADVANLALERAGHLERVDHRSLEAQGIERVPQIHLGPNVVRMEERGLRTERADRLLHIEERNRELGRMRAALIRLEQEKEAEERGRERTNLESPAGGPPEPGPGDSGRERERSRADDGSDLDPELARSHSRLDPAGARGRAAESEGGLEPDPGRDGLPDERDRPGTARAPRGALDRGDRLHRDRSGRGRDRGRDLSEDLVREPATPAARDRGRGDLASDEPGRAQATRETDGLAQTERIRRAVEQQLRGMGCAFFDLRVRDPETDRAVHRSWSKERVLANLPALQRMNARGHDIDIRPAAELDRPGLVLVDDLTPSALGTMERDGRGPAAVLETSPGKYQAWVRVPSRASERERGEIARRLAREYEADRGSASPLHFGRLAGFKKQKEVDRSRERSQPFALLRSARGREAPGGELLLRQAARVLQEPAREARMHSLEREEPEREFGGLASSRLPHTPATEREATDLCRREIEKSSRHIADPKQRDLAAAIRLAEVGYGARTIEQALCAASPDLEERTRGQMDRYVRVATQLALREHARQLERELDRDRGMER